MDDTFNVEQMSLWNRIDPKEQDLAHALKAKLAAAKKQETHIVVAKSPAEAVAAADIICVATYSDKALVELEMLQKNVAIHINGK